MISSPEQTTLSMGRGRGRAKQRGHRSPSPRFHGSTHHGSHSPEAEEERVVRQGSHSSHDVDPLTGRMAAVGFTAEKPIVTQVDRDIVKRGASRGSRKSELDDFMLKSRPKELESKQGSKGNPVKLITNFFKLKRGPMWTLYQYSVTIDPVEDKIHEKKRVLRLHKDHLGGYIYDGTKMYTSHELDASCLQFAVDTARPNQPPSVYQVTLGYVGKAAPGDPAYLHFYHLILRKCLFGMGLEEMGRNFYDHTAAIQLDQHKLALWPGFITTLRQHEKDVLLCVETAHKVLRLDNVLVTIRRIEQSARDRLAALQQELKDCIVLTSYNRKTYKIDDIDLNQNPMSTFECKNKITTYANYYMNKYGKEITDMKQPLLIARPSKKDFHRGDTGNTLLVPELCQFTGLTDDMRQNFQLMRELSKYLHVGPQERIKEINHFMSKLYNKNEVKGDLDLWGLEFDKRLLPVEGRVMNPETIYFDNGDQKADFKGDWTSAFRNQKMLSTINMTKWIVIAPMRDAPNVDNLVKTMSKVSAPLNMGISNPIDVVKLQDIKGPTYIRAINTVVEKYPDLQMLFVILPFNKPEPYGVVKKRLAVDFGIPSQCFVSKNVTSKGLMSIATKVVVQMNAKLGGEPWTIKLPLKKLMVVGFDVYHGAKGLKGGSVGAMVATTSPSLAKYFSTTSIFTSSDELSKTMVADFTKCCQAYATANGYLPERIVLFRDGVGEGQLPQVFETELEELVNLMRDLYVKGGLTPPTFTYIVVTKKINSRIMLDRGGGKYDNPIPGTVVDDVITIPERYDFYLVSCAARQGTVSPCCYNVLYDSQGLDPDKIQMMTYKMCHMYFNWSGTVAVPAPCQYAHKLAFITGTSYQGKANEKLGQLLHFL